MELHSHVCLNNVNLVVQKMRENIDHQMTSDEDM
jgi:hypothetical protein